MHYFSQDIERHFHLCFLLPTAIIYIHMLFFLPSSFLFLFSSSFLSFHTMFLSTASQSPVSHHTIPPPITSPPPPHRHFPQPPPHATTTHTTPSPEPSFRFPSRFPLTTDQRVRLFRGFSSASSPSRAYGARDGNSRVKGQISVQVCVIAVYVCGQARHTSTCKGKGEMGKGRKRTCMLQEGRHTGIGTYIAISQPPNKW